MAVRWQQLGGMSQSTGCELLYISPYFPEGTCNFRMPARVVLTCPDDGPQAHAQ